MICTYNSMQIVSYARGEKIPHAKQPQGCDPKHTYLDIYEISFQVNVFEMEVSNNRSHSWGIQFIRVAGTVCI